MKQSFSETDNQVLEEMKDTYRNPQMSENQISELKHRMEEAKRENRKKRRQGLIVKIVSAAAAILLAVVILPNTSETVAYAMQRMPVIGGLIKLVTVREYQHEDTRHKADITVDEITVDEAVGIPEEPESVQVELKKTTEEINGEIQSITDNLISEFKENMQDEEGYQDLMVKSELLATTQEYFTVKLLCYQGAGSGYQWNYYYTIDLNTGERLALRNLFIEGADYITPISENIISQMRAQMEADSNKYYWLESDIEEWNFKQIDDETSFYVNETGNVVIGFNEGDVAPMYMGPVEFEIDNTVLEGIRR